MADTKHLVGTPPVEGDGISYSGIIWFIVILTITTLFCQALVVGMFKVMEYRVASSETARSPLAAPAEHPEVRNKEGRATGRIVSATDEAPLPRVAVPTLVVSEPTVLGEFRKSEDASLSTYGWIDQAAGTVRLPINRAKDLVLERGLLPARQAAAPAPAAAAKKTTTAGH